MIRKFVKAISLLVFSLSASANGSETKGMEKLAVGQVGSHQELSEFPNPDNLVLLYIPGISALLERAKQIKGRELSEGEIVKIRSNATVMASTKDAAQATINERGYE